MANWLRYRATAVNPNSGITVTTQNFPTKIKMMQFVDKFSKELTVHTADLLSKKRSGLAAKHLGTYGSK